MKELLDELLILAKAASKRAYAPYSGYLVGSAVMTMERKVYTGCNVENASYSLTICAERNAVFKSISEGYQDIIAIAIYVDSDRLFPPCGACRQVLAEFNPRMEIVYANHKEAVYTTLDILLPGAFSL